MKLKRVVRSDDSWQHCCRWCKYFEKGKCYNKKVVEQVQENGITLSVYAVSEEGYASQTIEEVLNNETLIRKFVSEVEKCFEKWNISQKRREEFQKHFIECWSEFADFSLKEVLDEEILKCYATRIEDSMVNEEGVSIESPSSFSCKYWE